MDAGCYTALVTPFAPDGSLDTAGLEQLINFQIQNQITGILATGTTGESPTLRWEEHNQVIDIVASKAKGKCLTIAGTGSNNTQEALEATGHAAKQGVDAVLLVDPYYNGPSSLEIRKEYYEIIAGEYPDLKVIPYIIPGRVGAQLGVEDLAILAKNFKNVSSVKEATGNLDNMKKTRQLCGPDFNILSGDDGLTYEMIATPDIKACGAISVMSNIAPLAVSQMIGHLNNGETAQASKLQDALKPLFDIVVITTSEKTSFGETSCRARNPLPVKVLMQLLGMPSGDCRKPLGKMTQNGFKILLETAKKVQADHPEIFEPAAQFFNIDIDARLNDEALHKQLWYDYE